MRFVVSSTSLTEAITVAGRAVNKKNTLPILDYFLFELKQEKLTITGSDSQTTIRCTIDVESEDTGIFAIEVAQMTKALNTFTVEPLAFNIDNSTYRCNVSWNTGEFSIACVNGDAYPTMDQDSSNRKEIQIRSCDLLAGFKNTTFCTTVDNLMPQFGGVLFNIIGKQIFFAATNRHKLAEHIIAIESCTDGECLIPQKPAEILISLLTNDPTEITMTFDKRNAKFILGNVVVAFRLIEDRFPDYKAILPMDYPNVVTISVNTLTNAIKRCGVFADAATGLIVFHCTKGRLSIHAQDVDFARSAYENLLCEYEGEELEINFNMKYLLEIISHIKTDTLRIKLSSGSRPGIFTPTGESADTTTFLLMSMFIPKTK